MAHWPTLLVLQAKYAVLISEKFLPRFGFGFGFGFGNFLDSDSDSAESQNHGFGRPLELNMAIKIQE